MKKGFTLIELLVVIVIIGILATLATVGLNSVRAKARDSKRISDIRQMQSALELYFNDNNSYPTNGDFVIGTPLDSPDTTKTYMSKIPSNPKPWAEGACSSGGAEYAYSYISANSYQLSYCLANKVNDLPAGQAVAMPGNINSACNKLCGSTYGRYCGASDGCGGVCNNVPTSPIVTGSTSLTCTSDQLYCGTTLVSDYRLINQCNTNTANCSGTTCTAGQTCQASMCVTPECDASVCGDCQATACGSNCVTTIKKDGTDYTETYGTVAVDVNSDGDTNDMGECWMTKNISNVGYMVNGGDYADDAVKTIKRFCPGSHGSGASSGTQANCDTYGALYTWNEAMYLPATATNTVVSVYTSSGVSAKRQGVCPKGWHVPSDVEIYNLEKKLDSTIPAATPGSTIFYADCTSNCTGGTNGYRGASDYTNGAGAKMICTGAGLGYAGISISNCTAAAGSNVAPKFPLAGQWLDGNFFAHRDIVEVFLWSSTQLSGTGIWGRNIDSGCSRTNMPKVNGYSVRCVKD